MAQYGGAVTRPQFIMLACALCMGTLVEWYDFTVYSQLANVITQLFFPSSNPVVAQLSFWGVYAVGFLSRPAGAILFGHVGDVHGRRATLLWSVLLITLPTLLIGCMPTYQHIGMAAPILIAVLRLVQGLAVGGEFGSAITYLYEMAPVGRKGLAASLAQQAVAPGMMLGILVCQAVLYGCTQAQLLVWGWRVPFLATVFTAPLAIIMRMHMPEPFEFLQDKQHKVLERVASTAAVRVARTISRQSSLTGARSLSMTRVLSRRASDPAGPASAALSTRQVSLRLQRSVSIDPDCMPGGRDAEAPCGGQPGTPLSGADRRLSKQTRAQNLSLAFHREADGTDQLPPGCEEQFEQEIKQVAAVVKQHVPVKVLFRDNWRGLLTQFLFEANFGCLFYEVFSWLPIYLERSKQVSTRLSLWALMIGLALFAIIVPLAGHFVCDTKARQVWAYLAVTGVVSTAALPAMVALESGHVLGLWLVMPLMLGLAGVLGGIMTTIGPQIYSPAVRTTGYNLGHNLTMSLFGGLTPLIVSAISVGLKPPTTAAGIVLIATGLVTFCAAVALIKVAPVTNAPCPAGGYEDYLTEQADKARQQEDAVQLQPLSPAQPPAAA